MSIVALPADLTRAIADEASRLPREALIHAGQILSSSYRRQGEGVPTRLSDSERVAYAAMRMPATYAAVRATLGELTRMLDTSAFRHCLDAGAGPGTASFAARASIPSLESFFQVERDDGWSELARKLGAAAQLQAARRIGDLATLPKAQHDLVIAAYALNELPPARLDAAVRALWAATAAALVVVEPGTPHGFSIVRRARELCLELGAHAAAPCTHIAVCPMSVEDWCHRAVRVERGALHRQLKLAELGFEDEKFSYVALTRPAPRRLAPSRIVRRPIRAGGHVHLDLCSEAGLKRTTVGRAERVLYKAARDAEWGDLWPA